MDRAHDFATVAIQLGRATRSQVLDALDEQERLLSFEGRRTFLAEVMVRLGSLAYEDLVDVLEAARGYRERAITSKEQVRFGDLATWKGYVTPLQVFLALQQQRDEDQQGRSHRFLGEILVERGWLAAWELEDVLVSLAEMTFSTTRTGETPSEAIPLPGNLPKRARASARRAATALFRPRAWAPEVAIDVSVRVGEIMAPATCAHPLDTVESVLARAEDAQATHVVLVERERVVGVAAVADLRWLAPGATLEPFARPGTITTFAHASLLEALRTMRESGYGALPVLLGGAVVGILTRAVARRAGITRILVEGERWPWEELGGNG